MTQAEESYLAWACAGCFGKNFIAGFKHGVTSEVSAGAVRTAQIDVTIGGQLIPILKRQYSKSSSYSHEFFNPMGHAPNGPIDTQYVSYLDCGGSTEGDDGSYSVSSQFENSRIYFADLREDILVYYNEQGSESATTAGSSPIGTNLTYAEFEGTAGCKTLNILDAIHMPLSVGTSITRREIITRGDITAYSEATNSTTRFGVAASDRSGYSGGVAYDTYNWGDYAAIDETKPYNCSEGSYEELAKPDILEAYSNEWDYFGSITDMDAYDAAVFDAAYNGQGVNHLNNGTYDYPSFVNIDPMPRGSWCIDASGSWFYSMITAGLGVYNNLEGVSPESVSGHSGANLVFYPVAPV